MDRKSITFEQAEGLEPLPSQLKFREVSPELRALMWNRFYASLQKDIGNNQSRSNHIGGRWQRILRDKHVKRDHKMIDEFTISGSYHIDRLKTIFASGDYGAFFGFIQFVLTHASCPADLHAHVAEILRQSRAAYRLEDDGTVVPLASEGEARAVSQAFADLKQTEFEGAQRHLRQAAAELTDGNFAESVRESIHATESLARVLHPTDSLANSLDAMVRTGLVHPAMRAALTKLYGYSSREPGVRHPLLTDGDAKVDEADALFMLGACASFVSYMIAKGRAAGLLTV